MGDLAHVTKRAKGFSLRSLLGCGSLGTYNHQEVGTRSARYESSGRVEYLGDEIRLVACRAPSVLTRTELATESSLDVMKLASQQSWYMALSRSMASMTTSRSQVLRLFVELRKTAFAGGSMAPYI